MLSVDGNTLPRSSPTSFITVCPRGRPTKRGTATDSFTDIDLENTNSYASDSDSFESVRPPSKKMKRDSRQTTDSFNNDNPRDSYMFGDNDPGNTNSLADDDLGNTNSPTDNSIEEGLIENRVSKSAGTPCSRTPDPRTPGSPSNHESMNSDPPDQFQCPQCIKITRTARGLGLHQTSFHKEFSCENCSTTFEGKKAFDIHKKNCLLTNPFEGQDDNAPLNMKTFSDGFRWLLQEQRIMNKKLERKINKVEKNSREENRKLREEVQKVREDVQKVREDVQKVREDVQKTQEDVRKTQEDVRKTQEDVRKINEKVLTSPEE